MSELLLILKDLFNHIEELKKPWALVGALAINEYAEQPRFTSDIDIAIFVVHDEAEDVLRSFALKGYVTLQVSAHPELQHITSARLLGLNSTYGRFFIDIIFSSTEVEKEITNHVQKVEILPNLIIPIARRGHLVAMKLLAINSRERTEEKTLTDKADILSLLKSAKEKDIEDAKKLARLINERSSLDLPNLNKLLEEYL